MFFRIKKIKGKEYVYAVENSWKKKGSRQKVKGYLGRAHKLALANDVDFLKFLNVENMEQYVNSNDHKKIIHDLLRWEMHKHSVNENEFSIDIHNAKIQKENKNVVLLLNEGYLCSQTLSNIINFKSADDEESDGYNLARSFVEAGIKVPREVFVGLFGKLYNVEHK